ncbi:phosphoadenylyl-sulfate reductase [Aestuariivirga sp.]|uniref:phosphoadenylyl-sulfate reductase n=1 Tax=Aestuariivirga sp. TaxID=2650926 RepID=UPI0025C0FCA7|nr:phosphoadenylyl-sulfate reductase [Aestuariivirga sp.]MCA3554835.1 phosphoadenylyl-sulfate reductase [Aestuariivirga sp.]
MDRAVFESYAGLEGRELLGPILRDFAGRAAVVSSFGAESAVLLHMVSQVDTAAPVIFLDTGKHFWETLSYRARLIDRLGLTGVRIIKPDEADLAAGDAGGTLHKTDADACCRIRKTVPLARALEGFDVTISGRKRYHGAARATLDFLSIADGRLKVEPLAGFSALGIAAYMKAHDLPGHPLTGIGYFSIGCEPCTQAGGDAADPRAGRWAGSAKTECGIHWTHNGATIAAPARASH